MSADDQSVYMPLVPWSVQSIHCYSSTDCVDWSSFRQYAWLLDLVWRLAMAILRSDNNGGCELPCARQLNIGDICTVSLPLSVVGAADLIKCLGEEAEVPDLTPHSGCRDINSKALAQPLAAQFGLDVCHGFCRGS